MYEFAITSVTQLLKAANGGDRQAADELLPLVYDELGKLAAAHINRTWLPHTVVHALKIIHALIRELPTDGSYQYRVVLMQRPLDEVLASQTAMLARDGRPSADPAVLRPAFERQLDQLLPWLRAQTCVRVLPVEYQNVINDPRNVAERVGSFLDQDLDREAMLRAVDPALYRQRR